MIFMLMLRFCENAINFLLNHNLRFVLCSNGQIYSGNFAKFCGLLRIYELYIETRKTFVYLVCTIQYSREIRIDKRSLETLDYKNCNLKKHE